MHSSAAAGAVHRCCRERRSQNKQLQVRIWISASQNPDIEAAPGAVISASEIL